MASTNYAVNYDDERFTEVEQDKQEALTDIEQTYGGMVSETDKYFQDQIDASKQWADIQSQLQKDQTDFAIEQIEQQKDKAHADYLKEQSGAYVDWQKQSNEYGANAEKMASSGLDKTGFSESSQVSMYNTYQNRVATAKQSFSQAVLNYDNAIKDARLQNNAVLAEIAYQSLQQQLELSLQGFQYKNQLLLEQANKKIEVENMYWNRYQDVLGQINTENALAENIRQFNQNYELQVKEYNEQIRQFNEEIARLKKKDEQEYQLQIQELELKKQQAEEEKRQWEEEMKLAREQLEEEKRQFDAQMKKSSGGGSSKSTSSVAAGVVAAGKGVLTGVSAALGLSGNSSNTQKIEKKKSVVDTIAGTIEQALNNLPLDYTSLTKIGLSGASRSTVISKVKSGQIIPRISNGEVTFKKNPISTLFK